MNLQRKIEIAATAIFSISQHDDEDSAVRQAALDLVEKVIAAERAAINTRVAASVAQATASAAP